MKLSTTIPQIAPHQLAPHPQNYQIYGNEDVGDLVELIRHSGWVKPIVCTSSYTIISGHRRWKAALELGLERLPIEVKDFPDEVAELEALLLENASRFKTIEQKVREAKAWQEVEEKKARQRMSDAAKALFQGVENFPHPEKGKTRDRIASLVGLGSGRTYQKAAKVVTQSDKESDLGHQEVARVLRKTLNEQSVDAAHALLKKTPEELQAISNLITSGKAKSTRQAVKMVNQNNSKGSKDYSQPILAGFSVGDWVEVNKNVYDKTYIGRKGRVEQILAAENQISVSFEDSPDKLRFDPCELSLLVKAAPQNPTRAGDIVFVRIERQEAASPQERMWNGCWGKVTQIGEMGSLKVDVGKEALQLFPRDVKPIDSAQRRIAPGGRAGVAFTPT